MIWGKRRFQDAEYGPYQDRLDKLAMADARVVDQYCMVSVETSVAVADYYVGVPNEDLMRFFDGFERVPEDQLPKEIDAIHLDAGCVHRLFKVKELDA
jgi:hypothetical protein